MVDFNTCGAGCDVRTWRLLRRQYDRVREPFPLLFMAPATFTGFPITIAIIGHALLSQEYILAGWLVCGIALLLSFGVAFLEWNVES